MTKIFICLLFIVLNIIPASGQKFNLNNTLTIFDNRNSNMFNSIGYVAIAGWSPDGKIAVIQTGSVDSPVWMIIDTVTDDVLAENYSDKRS